MIKNNRKFITSAVIAISVCGIVCVGLALPVAASTTLEASKSGTLAHTAADVPINLTLSPVSLAITAQPGDTVNQEIKIRNNGSIAEQLVIKVGSFAADSTGDKPKLLEPQSSDIFINWLHVEQTPFTVNPGEWKSIPIAFTPPSDAALSYFYTLIVQRVSDNPTVGDTTVLKGAPAVLVLATVESPNAKRELVLSSFKTKKTFLEFLPADFELEIKNTGNVYVVPTGNIFIDGQGKKDIAVLSVNQGSSAILPTTTRTFTVPWQDGFPFYSPVIVDDKEVQNADGSRKYHLSWDFNQINHLRFGRYTAHLILVYDNGQRDVPIESSVNFWVIPVRMLAAVIAIPTIPMLLVYLIMKRRLSQVQKQVKNSV